MSKYIHISIIALLALFATTCDTPDDGPTQGMNNKISISLSITSTNSNSVFVNISIDNHSNRFIDQIGVVYSRFYQPSIEDSENLIVVGSSSTSQLIPNQEISGLNSSTGYYIRPFFLVDGTYGYGESEHVTTAIGGNGGVPGGTLIFEDTFSSASSSLFKSGDYSTSSYQYSNIIEGGYYKLNYDRAGYYAYSTASISQFDYTKDFRIRIDFKFVSDTVGFTSECGIVWGQTSSDMLYFVADEGQNYWAGYNLASIFTSWVDYSYAPVISPSLTNSLELVRYNGVLYFYINGNELYTHNAVQINSRHLGFYFQYGASWIDRILVYRID